MKVGGEGPGGGQSRVAGAWSHLWGCPGVVGAKAQPGPSPSGDRCCSPVSLVSLGVPAPCFSPSWPVSRMRPRLWEDLASLQPGLMGGHVPALCPLPPWSPQGHLSLFHVSAACPSPRPRPHLTRGEGPLPSGDSVPGILGPPPGLCGGRDHSSLWGQAGVRDPALGVGRAEHAGAGGRASPRWRSQPLTEPGRQPPPPPGPGQASVCPINGKAHPEPLADLLTQTGLPRPVLPRQ